MTKTDVYFNILNVSMDHISLYILATVVGLPSKQLEYTYAGRF